jgi:hypothetical protein
MPAKDWKEIQGILKRIGLEGSLNERMLAPHELDALTAALTGYLHMRGLTENIGGREEGFIVVPIRQDWRRITL